MAQQARELVTKIRRVSGYQHKWKLITVQIGGNDVCSVSCGAAEGDASPKGRCYKLIKRINALSLVIIMNQQLRQF